MTYEELGQWIEGLTKEQKLMPVTVLFQTYLYNDKNFLEIDRCSATKVFENIEGKNELPELPLLVADN